MALRNIRKEDEPCLYQVCRAVDKFDGRLATLIDDMFDTMAAADGVGLAAPQVGILKRVIVIDVGDDISYALVNPEIIASSGKAGMMEGCLSFPEKRGYVERAEKVTVRGFDRDGCPVEKQAEGLEARALQHEIDHLNGIVYLTRVTEPPEGYAEKNNI